MISSILHSPEAIKISIRIMDAFVAMRHFMLENAQVFQRLERIEYKQFETDQKLEQVFAKLAENTIKPQQGIFFDGQVYDAYELVCNLIKDANNKIILIDNYIDDTVLTMLDKRKEWVEAVIYTQQVSNQFKLDLAKHDKQYPAIEVYLFKKAHDRFLIIDETVYLIGASIKDLGKKWFGITAMTATHPNELIARLNDGATSI